MAGRGPEWGAHGVFLERAVAPMTSADLLQRLGAFEPGERDAFRTVRRPAGQDMLLEVEAVPAKAAEAYEDLAAFWLAALWRLVEDAHQNTLAFEGIAFQALAETLTEAEFGYQYGLLRGRLKLAPPYPVELREAYRVLNGRLVSFAGLTPEGEFWASFYQSDVYQIDVDENSELVD